MIVGDGEFRYVVEKNWPLISKSLIFIDSMLNFTAINSVVLNLV